MRNMRWRESSALRALFLGVVFLALAQVSVSSQGKPDYDVLILGALIYDGSGGAPFQADIGVKDGRIARVAKGLRVPARRVIDAHGLVATPGFIDMHTHVDEDMVFPEHRAALNYLKQGVTTVVVGQCGGSAWPYFEKAKDQVERFTSEGVGPNTALLVGHGDSRQPIVVTMIAGVRGKQGILAERELPTIANRLTIF